MPGTSGAGRRLPASQLSAGPAVGTEGRTQHAGGNSLQHFRGESMAWTGAFAVEERAGTGGLGRCGRWRRRGVETLP